MCLCINTWRQKMSGRGDLGILLTGDHVHRDEVKKTISAWDCQKRQKSLAKKTRTVFPSTIKSSSHCFFNKTSASLTLRCLFYLNLLESHALSMAWGRSHSAPIRPNSSQILANILPNNSGQIWIVQKNRNQTRPKACWQNDHNCKVISVIVTVTVVII